MLLSRKEINIWPAFSDLMFVLAITMLVIGGAVVVLVKQERDKLAVLKKNLEKKEQRLQGIREKLKVAGINPDNIGGCGLADPVVQVMEDCLRSHGVAFERRECSLAVESSITFGFNQSRLDPGSRQVAGQVAQCVIMGARKLVEMEQPMSASKTLESGVALDAISIEGHADACGYRSWAQLQREGIPLPHNRAQAVYDLVFEAMKDLDDISRYELLAHIATRAFGPYRPLRDSACDCQSSSDNCAQDRRVEIIVQGRVGASQPNWKPLRKMQWAPGRRLRHNGNDHE